MNITNTNMTGMSESLARELEPFGIRVLVVEPGSLRTNFWSAYVEPRAGMNKAYVGTPLEDVLRAFKTNTGTQPGNAVRCAQRILEVVDGTDMGVGKENLFRLPLGSDCYKRLQNKVEALQGTLLQTKELAHSTNY